MDLEEKITTEYTHLHSVKEISNKYNLSETKIRAILRRNISKETRINLGHKIGGKVIAKKLKEPQFRAKYISKMRKTVSNTINQKMKNSAFKLKWIKKAKVGSKKGISQLKRALKNEMFYTAWQNKCQKGGNILKQSKKGIFNVQLQKYRKKWSTLGLQNTSKKVKGPHNEKMYNLLEKETALTLSELELNYEYEKIIPAPNINGFYSVDFFLPNKAIIEVTYWDKIDEKCIDLNKKLKFLKTKFPTYKFIVVTKKPLADTYKRLLAANIFVVADKQLKALITKLTSNKQ